MDYIIFYCYYLGTKAIRALKSKEMNKQIGPKVKQVWNVARLTLDNFLLWFCHKHNSLPLGPIKPSSPSTKELHAQSICLCTCNYGFEPWTLQLPTLCFFLNRNDWENDWVPNTAICLLLNLPKSSWWEHLKNSFECSLVQGCVWKEPP